MNRDYVWVAIAVALVLVFLLKRRGGVGLDEAKAALDSGAVLIDVRSVQEFSSGSVRGAINIPLDRVVAEVGKRFPNKETVLLCHCASGMRSGSAVSQLKAAGYANAQNVGSYGRASKLAK